MLNRDIGNLAYFLSQPRDIYQKYIDLHEFIDARLLNLQRTRRLHNIEAVKNELAVRRKEVVDEYNRLTSDDKLDELKKRIGNIRNFNRLMLWINLMYEEYMRLADEPMTHQRVAPEPTNTIIDNDDAPKPTNALTIIDELTTPEDFMIAYYNRTFDISQVTQKTVEQILSWIPELERSVYPQTSLTAEILKNILFDIRLKRVFPDDINRHPESYATRSANRLVRREHLRQLPAFPFNMPKN